jgi:hypothetical protein
MSILEKIRPVKYKWNGLWGRLNDDREVVGIIGQELESVASYAIVRSKDTLYPGGPQTEVIQVHPTPLVFLLVNAVKDLRSQIEELEKLPGASG